MYIHIDCMIRGIQPLTSGSTLLAACLPFLKLMECANGVILCRTAENDNPLPPTSSIRLIGTRAAWQAVLGDILCNNHRPPNIGLDRYLGNQAGIAHHEYDVCRHTFETQSLLDDQESRVKLK